jgi:hypothetical protein
MSLCQQRRRSPAFVRSHRKFSRVVFSSILLLCFAFLSSPLVAKIKPAPALDDSYVPALAAADHFLQAWQTGDVENGMALLTNHAKEKAAADGLDTFFSSKVSAYEVGRGKQLKRGRYEFPIVLVSNRSKHSHPYRRFSSILIVDTGHNDWAVDKLP